MSRNFGIGQRDMGKAGDLALTKARQKKSISFSTAATQSARWNSFCTWAREIGVKKMENVTGDIVISYGKKLSAEVDSGKMSPSTAQNYVSAVNSVMSIATIGHWKSISPTNDCHIKNRTSVRTDAPEAINRSAFETSVETVRENGGDRAAAIVELARNFGLRSKEASLLDAKSALKQARRDGVIKISDGTKGGLTRAVSILDTQQIETLVRAAHAQGNARAVMPMECNWQKWREGQLREAREILQAMLNGGLHDLRSAYACERYQTLTGHPTPCAGGIIQDRSIDLSARLQIARELGHGRVDVVSEYVGGRK